MKMMKFVLLLAIVMSTVLTVCAEKKDDKTVVFNANLHCESCKAKIEKNIPYEKGVKALEVNMETQTVKVTFREDKNTTESIQKAIEKLNIEVKGIVGEPKAAGEKKCGKATCCQGKEKGCGEKEGACCQSKKK